MISEIVTAIDTIAAAIKSGVYEMLGQCTHGGATYTRRIDGNSGVGVSLTEIDLSARALAA